jgi:uncharacterized RDD family membrane protein YckC
VTADPAPEARAAPTGAAPGRRLLAALYDVPALVTLLLAGTALLLAANRGVRLDAHPLTAIAHRALLVTLWGGYYAVCWVRWGQTLGMKVWAIRVHRTDGSPLRWSDAMLRLATGLVAWAPFALGVFAAAFDPRRRAWHDRWSRTQVVRIG